VKKPRPKPTPAPVDYRTVGRVSLVGAGPGVVDLLTLRAVRRLETADLVLYDALVDDDVVALAANAQRFSVGKRARRGAEAQPRTRATSQAIINRLMIRAARTGKRVVRLKCGDPFVLGRGGEEALALRDAGVPFEVVPGVTSAVAAPALAGVPITHRGISSGFLVVSGHDEDAFAPLVDPLPPNSVTIVVLMGLATRGRIAARLIRAGWRAETPTAVVLAAGAPAMRTWRGPLQALGKDDVEAVGADGAPGTLVIGDVVALGSSLRGRLPTPTRESVAFGGRHTR